MGDDLEARLKSHARAFEGLMSLIPAKDYYGKDESITSTQWMKKKKQTREERQAAKRAKLDPASHKSAKDVMDENARKRKRELKEGQEADSSDVDMDIEKEKPLEGLRQASSKAKKQKTGQDSLVEASITGQDDTRETKAKSKAEKKRLKHEKKKEKQAKKQGKQQQKKAQQKEFSAALGNAPEKEADAEEDATEWEDEDDTMHEDRDNDGIQGLDVSDLVDASNSTATPSPADSIDSTSSVVSAASSSTSIIPPATVEAPQKKKERKPPKELDPKQHDAFRARLMAKLEAMRSARKADGPDGRPARNRAELIEARRKKEADRKAAKKANRQIAKEDEARINAEAELARLRGGSGSPSLFPMRLTPEQEHNLAFGRVAWKDGQQLESNLGGFLESKKRKGVSDAKTALEAAQKKKARINGLDEAKRKDIAEKDAWLNAKKRAQGERVHDNEDLLRKTVKRKEKAKAKSKQEWDDRITGIQKGKEAKQKKREENLRKRREEKGSKGKGKKVKKLAKKVRRPGFEGTFKAW